MKAIAIIPARGGSKGIPGKNIRLLAGKPLLAYSIEHAFQSPYISRVIVSTDDPKIAAVAVKWNAEVIWRPAELSHDKASSESALRHVLDTLEKREGYRPDLVVFLQATSPLRPHGAIDNAIQTLIDEGADSLFSASPQHGFLWRKIGDQLQSFTYDYRSRSMRQDAPEDLVENGSIYVFRSAILLKENNRLGGKISVLRMESLYSFQVDDPSDLALIEALVPLAQKQTLHNLHDIRMLVLDFDGVMTDNRVFVDETGREGVACHRGDGWGIGRLVDAGFSVWVLSTETNCVVSARCRKLRIGCRQGHSQKLPALHALAAEQGLSPGQIAYVGNDLNDLDCLKWVGLPIAVADAVPEVRAIAQWVTSNPGGFGAVREVTDLLLRSFHLSTIEEPVSISSTVS